MEKIVKEIIDNSLGKKWEIIEQEKYGFTVKYFEKLGGSWKYLAKQNNYSKEVLEFQFGKIF